MKKVFMTTTKPCDNHLLYTNVKALTTALIRA